MKSQSQIIKEIDEKQDAILSNLNFESIVVYSFLKDEYTKGNILSNFVFQFVFRSYYRLDNAGLSDEIKSRFFELLSEKQIDLKTILSELHKIPTLKGKKTIQFSFATKLLHTIDNNKPIFDSEIAKLIKSKQDGSDKETKICSCLKIYDFLKELYAKLKEDYKIKKVISKFRTKFKVDDEKISDTKVLDFIMWSLGKLKKEKQNSVKGIGDCSGKK